MHLAEFIERYELGETLFWGEFSENLKSHFNQAAWANGKRPRKKAYSLVVMDNRDLCSKALYSTELIDQDHARVIFIDCSREDLLSSSALYNLEMYSLEDAVVAVGSVRPTLCFEKDPICKILDNPLLLKAERVNNKSRTLLWVMNVCWQGGTAHYVLDAIKSFGKLWRHRVIYVSGQENQETYEKFLEAGADISFCPTISKAMVSEINPAAIILSNTDPNKIEGEHPWLWLTHNYPVVYIHHSPVHPWLPGVETEIFVSNFLMKHYDNLKQHLKNPVVIPPGIHTSHFSNIPRSPLDKDNITIGYLASDNPGKYPQEILDIVHAVKERVGKNIKLSVVGGEKFLRPLTVNYELELLPFTNDVVSAYKSFDVFLYKTKKINDTWGRNVSEAMASGLPVLTYDGGAMTEQIDHGINGFICKNDSEYIENLSSILTNSVKRYEIGMNARIKAMENFDISLLSSYLEPIFLRYVI